MNVSVHILLNVTKLISCTFHSKNRKHTKDAQKRHLPSLFFFFFCSKGRKKKGEKRRFVATFKTTEQCSEEWGGL